MKALKTTWVVLALISSFSVFGATVGERDVKVKCTESHQSARYEGGRVEVEDYTSDNSEKESNNSDR